MYKHTYRHIPTGSFTHIAFNAEAPSFEKGYGNFIFLSGERKKLGHQKNPEPGNVPKPDIHTWVHGIDINPCDWVRAHVSVHVYVNITFF